MTARWPKRLMRWRQSSVGNFRNMNFSMTRLWRERRLRRAFEPLRVSLQEELSSFLKRPCLLVPARGKGGYDRLYYVDVEGQRIAIMRVKNCEADRVLAGVATGLRRALTSVERLEHEWQVYTRLSVLNRSPKPMWRTPDAIVSSYYPYPRASEVLRSEGKKVWTMIPHLFALVREMHEAKVVHLDLNLGNMLVEPETNRVLAIDFEYAPSEALSFEQACLYDYCRVINDLLRPRRGGRELQKDIIRFIAQLGREMPTFHSAVFDGQMQAAFPNIMKDGLESIIASSKQ
jgi:Phosphotransferase enzyme family